VETCFFDAKLAKLAKNAKRSALETASKALEPRHRQSTSPSMMDCASKRRVKIFENAVRKGGHAITALARRSF
jgi:hypothetical protein